MNVTPERAKELLESFPQYHLPGMDEIEWMHAVAELKAAAPGLAKLVLEQAEKIRALENRLQVSVEFVEGTAVGYGEDEIDRLELKTREQAEEIQEQARLLGMSGEREAKLLAEVERLKRSIKNMMPSTCRPA